MKADELSKTKDYIYVHFLERVESYVRNGKVKEKIKISSIDAMSKGVAFTYEKNKRFESTPVKEGNQILGVYQRAWTAQG